MIIKACGSHKIIVVNEVIRNMGASYVWGDTLPLIKKADMLLINLECVIAKNGTSWDKTPKLFFFRADPHAIDVLKIAGVNYVSLANNHTLDFGEEALLEMLNRLDNAGIAHVCRQNSKEGASNHRRGAFVGRPCGVLHPLGT